MPEEQNNGQLKPKLNGAIRFDHVALNYADGVQAIKDFSLDILPGQTVALVGRSGAGKSSLVNMLVRFKRYQVGKFI